MSVIRHPAWCTCATSAVYLPNVGVVRTLASFEALFARRQISCLFGVACKRYFLCRRNPHLGRRYLHRLREACFLSQSRESTVVSFRRTAVSHSAVRIRLTFWIGRTFQDLRFPPKKQQTLKKIVARRSICLRDCLCRIFLTRRYASL